VVKKIIPETKEVYFALPGRQLGLLVVKDVEKLITDPADEDKIPCWAEIWPAARGLSRWIWDNLEFNGAEVLELGAGLGLPGIVCGLKGARVTFSDFNPLALKLAAGNAARNGLAAYEVLLGDWRDFRIEKRFPWVIGSDIFYDPKLNAYLQNVLDKTTDSGSCLLAAHPGRPATFAFLEELGRRRRVEEQRAVVPVTVDDPYFPYYEIHVHHIKFK